MSTWIALFRGINVGGKNILPMKELVTMLESIGCSSVRTYIQSGNVVFEEEGTPARQLAGRISEAVSSCKGFEPQVMLLTARELEKILRENPYKEAEAEPKTLHVSFLSDDPKSAKLNEMNQLKSDSEEFSLSPRAFYLHAPDGIGRSKLAAKAERLLGVAATSRNWRTACKLLELTKDQG